MTYFRIVECEDLVSYLYECVAEGRLDEDFPVGNFLPGKVVEVTNVVSDDAYIDCMYQGSTVTFHHREVVKLTPLQVLALEA